MLVTGMFWKLTTAERLHKRTQQNVVNMPTGRLISKINLKNSE